MDQISPPFRIALLALLAVGALWFTVLKPKDPGASAPATTPAAPGATGLGNDVNAAKGAAATSDAANAKVQAATGGTAAKTSTGAHAAVAGNNGAAATTAHPKAKAATDAAARLLRALDRKRAVVLLVYNRRGADDRAVRRAVAATDTHKGRVVVTAVPVEKIGRYESITRGGQVLQAPTVLVIGPDRKARSVVGFTTTSELDQLVGDALAAAK